MPDELDIAVKRSGSINPELREIGRRDLERLYLTGSAAAGVELAHVVLGSGYDCRLGKAEAVSLLVTDLRLTGSGLAFLNLYYYGGDLVSDDLMFELLTLAAPNSAEAQEILDARLPGWRHPRA